MCWIFYKSFLEKVLFIFDIFKTFIRISAEYQKMSHISKNNVLIIKMFVAMLSLDPRDVREVLICQFRVDNENWWTWEVNFSSMLAIFQLFFVILNLKYILSKRNSKRWYAQSLCFFCHMDICLVTWTTILSSTSFSYW